jgi:hypothetical protein
MDMRFTSDVDDSKLAARLLAAAHSVPPKALLVLT